MAERSIDKRRILILILDILVVLSVAYAVLGMVFAKDNSALVTGGRGAFKYYTVLSNVFCALTSILVVLSVAYAVLGMVFAKDNSALVTGGRGAFKYYTVLSNVFCALTSDAGHTGCPVCRICRAGHGVRKGQLGSGHRRPRGLQVLHSSLQCVLRPDKPCLLDLHACQKGQHSPGAAVPPPSCRKQCRQRHIDRGGVCLWLHLFAPVLSIISQMLLRPQAEIRLRSTVWAVVPTILYGAVYIIVNAVNWTGKSNHVTDMYGFLRWGWAIGAMLLVAICLINWLVAVLFRKCAGKGKTN